VYREALFITALPSTKYAVYIFDHRLQSYIWLPAYITNIYVGLESNNVRILHIIWYS
jgi:hypothetical protein